MNSTSIATIIETGLQDFSESDAVISQADKNVAESISKELCEESVLLDVNPDPARKIDVCFQSAVSLHEENRYAQVNNITDNLYMSENVSSKFSQYQHYKDRTSLIRLTPVDMTTSNNMSVSTANDMCTSNGVKNMDARLICLVCQHSFKEIFELQSHMLIHTNVIHGQSLPPSEVVRGYPLICVLCDFSCKLKCELLKHMIGHFNDVDVDEEEILKNALKTSDNNNLASLVLSQMSTTTEKELHKIKAQTVTEKSLSLDSDWNMVNSNAHNDNDSSDKYSQHLATNTLHNLKNDLEINEIEFEDNSVSHSLEDEDDYQGHQNLVRRLRSSVSHNYTSVSKEDEESAVNNDSNVKATPALTCSICDFTCQTKNSLTRHVKLCHSPNYPKEKVHSCHFCKETFTSSTLYKKHLTVSHSDKKPFSCNQCQFTCWDKSGLKKHKLTHTDYRPFSCSVCDYRCRRAERLQEHMFMHQDIHPYQCDKCGYKTRRKSLLNSHKRFRCSQSSKNQSGDCKVDVKKRKRISKATKTKRRPLNQNNTGANAAEMCDAKIKEEKQFKNVPEDESDFDFSSFVRKNKLEEDKECRHSVVSGNNTSKSEDASGNSLNSSIEDKGEACADTNGDDEVGLPLEDSKERKPFALLYNRIEEECEKIIKNTQRPERGQGRKILTCSLCSYTTRKASHLRRHMLTHTTEKPITCDQCDYKCKSKHHLKRHMIRHSGVKPFSCELCDFSCYEQGDLNSHMRIHTNSKTFHCLHCDYSARTQYHLNEHAVVHSDNKPFLCSECGKSFKRKSRLNQHMFEHSNEKNISCSYCPFKCHRQSELNKHMIKHLTPEERAEQQAFQRKYLCPECGFASSSASNLRQHIRTHSNEKPFACMVCSFRSRTKGEVKKHARKHQPSSSLSCEYCSFKCKHEFSLRRHTLKHTCTDPFKCPMCNFTSVVRYYLKRHMRNKHNIDYKDGSTLNTIINYASHFSCQKPNDLSMSTGEITQHL